MIFSEIWKAVGYLFIAALVNYIYFTSYNYEGNWKTILKKGFLWCAGGAMVMMFFLGQPTCIDREVDPRGSICNEYADDGFEPTNERRIASFSYYFVLSFVPVLVAVYKRRETDSIVDN